MKIPKSFVPDIKTEVRIIEKQHCKIKLKYKKSEEGRKETIEELEKLLRQVKEDV